jgi:hypothetical protein
MEVGSIDALRKFAADTGDAHSYAKARKSEREQLESDIQAYLDAGGSITRVENGVSAAVGPKGEYIAGVGAWSSSPAPEQQRKPASRPKQQKYWARTGVSRMPIMCDTCGENAPWVSFRNRGDKPPFSTCKPCRDARRGINRETS